MALTVDAVVSAPDWAALGDLDALTRKVALAALKESGARLRDDCEVCVSYCDDEDIRALNAQWRGLDKPTNVLSFPTPGDLARKPLLGDVVIAFETVSREAREQDKKLVDYVCYMIAHGFLHILGYDHETALEAEAMESLERRVAEALGIPDPYEGTTPLAADVVNKSADEP